MCRSVNRWSSSQRSPWADPKIPANRRITGAGDRGTSQNRERSGRSKGHRRLCCPRVEVHAHDGHGNAKDRSPSAKGFVLTYRNVCCHLLLSFCCLFALENAILPLIHWRAC